MKSSGSVSHKCVIVHRGGAHDTDEDATVQNPWKWTWMEFVTRTGERVSESIRKIKKPGYAMCIVCSKEIKYANRGRIALTEHLGKESHTNLLKLRRQNTLLPGKLKLYY
jgi:hypothetical protein